MASATVFEEDEISYFDGKTLKCGLVLESSEFVSSDEEEDNPFVPKLKKGAIRVAWHPDGMEEELDEAKVKLADRSLMPGDVVRRMIEGEDSQRGYVRTTHVNCHLQIFGTNKVLCNIDSKLLQPIMFWDPEPGDVTLDSWVGKIECTNEQVYLSFPDGASCVVDDDEYLVELYEFEDLSDKRDKDSEFFMKDYFPGQRLRGELGLLESANWIKTTTAHSGAATKKHPERKVTVTVIKTEPKTIDVHWLCRGYAQADDPLEQMGAPPNSLEPTDIARLKKLDCFESCSVQIGDKDFYTIRENDVIIDIPAGRKNMLNYVLDKYKTRQQQQQQATAAIDAATQDLNALNSAANEKNAKNSEEAVGAQKLPQDGAGEKNVHMKKALENAQTNKAQESAQTNEAQNEDKNQDKVEDKMQGNEMQEKVQNPESPVKAVEGDDSDYEDEDDSASDAESTASAKSNTSNSSASKAKIIVKKTGVGSSGSLLQNKLMRNKKKYKKQTKKVKKVPKQYKPGDRVAVEIIYTFSTIDVMWQDGIIERDIPSVDLYPIHHLDELEFFPGDFVIRNTELASIESSYGVVEKVDHRGRCCLVRWMRPYQVGKSNKPDQSIGPEEVSVYDIKDHPDYKFRPGHVVVRVGGYEESHCEAAGQVYELRPDGHLLIRWANGKLSNCWPQELFLIGDELEDMESLELSSSDDESSGDESADSASLSGGSWETEDEDETVAPDKASGSKELTVEAEKKIELDQLLETARSTLQKLEDMFSQNVEINPYAVHCYREILHIYRNCRELDSMLNASYFTDPTLAENVGAIKTELKKERSAKMTKQVQELFECNVRLPEAEEENAAQQLVTEPNAKESTGDSAVDHSSTTSDRSNSTQSVAVESNVCDSATTAVKLSDLNLQESKSTESNSQESETSTSNEGPIALSVNVSKDDATDTTGKDSTSCAQGSTSSTIGFTTAPQSGAPSTATGVESTTPDAQPVVPGTPTGSIGATIPATPGTPSDALGTTIPATPGEALGATTPATPGTPGDALGATTPATPGTPGFAAGNRKAKDLCQTTCRLLKEQIMKVHDDLDRQWTVLREAGVILSREDINEDESEGGPKETKSESVQTAAQTSVQTSTSESALTSDSPPKPEALPTDEVRTTPEKHSGGETTPKTVTPPSVTPPNTTTPPATCTPPRPKMELKLRSPLSAESSPGMTTSTCEPPTPQTPAEIREKILYNKDGFKLLERCPLTHKFYSQDHQPSDIKSFLGAVKKELKMLNTSLPIGIYVKGFEDRMDLFSVMILGPTRTPYEDGLFFFDVQLSNNYPATPPSVHYISFCSDRLNPNLYEDGKVCVSLLGTWQGRGTEVWTNKSSLLQVLISIQGLILVSEPYYNEAGYEKQKGTQQGQENSRMYNEMAILKMVQSMMKMTVNPPSVFEAEVKEHMNRCAHRMIRRLHYWLELSSDVKSPITSPSVSATGLTTVAQPSGGAKSDTTAMPTSGDVTKSDTALEGDTKQEVAEKAISEAKSASGGETGAAHASDSGIACDESKSVQDTTKGGEITAVTAATTASKAADTKNRAIVAILGSSEPVTHAPATAPFPAPSTSPAPFPSAPSTTTTVAVFWRPEFPLLPASRGFCLSMLKTLPQFSRVLEKHGIVQKPAY